MASDWDVTKPQVDMTQEVVAQDRPDRERRSVTPEAPSWSPITPTLKSGDLPTVPDVPPLDNHMGRQSQQKLPDTISRPPEALATTPEDNPDAIAVQAALDILQIQRLNAIKDIRTLRTQKEAALTDAQGFIRALADGRLSGSSTSAVSSAEMTEDAAGGPQDQASAQNGDRANVGETTDTFERLPTPQNVIRCPPVNWNKYRVDGQSLESIHQMQSRRPSVILQPTARESATMSNDHVLSGPYRPFIDKI